MNFFITGTDTHIGKTYVSSLLASGLRRQGATVTALKPISCGDREDAVALLEASGSGLSIEDVNPLALKAPLSPFAASLLENCTVELAPLAEHCRRFENRADHLIVEGAGGWEVPVSADLSMADFAALLGYPAVVVIDNKLGALNHTILTVRSIEAFEVPIAGLVLNHVADERDPASISNRAILEEFLGLPILAEIMHGEDELDPSPFLEASV